VDLAGLIPSFGNLALTIVAFLLALIPIVFVHEFGHYIVGRWSGIKADVFSIGAGPVLVSRTDKRGTRWQIAALPIGGYVRFHGDANAASGSADETALSVMDKAELAAGPLINFLFSAVIFTVMAFWTGVASDPLTVAELKPVAGVEGTLQPGDEILAIAGRETPALEEFGAFVEDLPQQSPLDWTVRRDGVETRISTLHPYPPLVDSVNPQSAASDAGLRAGDLIETIDGQPVATFAELREIVGGGDGAALALGINRGGERIDLTLEPRRVDLPLSDGSYETRWLIGISGGLVFEPATDRPGIIEAVSAGAGQVSYIIRASLSGIWHMVTGAISSCNLRGVITIADTSGEVASQGVSNFIWFVAVLSTAIGLLNLFPIPVLDGGHLMFHAWEALTGRAPSDKVLNLLTMIGLALVLGIMMLGLFNDLTC